MKCLIFFYSLDSHSISVLVLSLIFVFLMGRHSSNNLFRMFMNVHVL